MIRFLSIAPAWCAVVVLIGAATPAHAYLGSFANPNDGYDVQSAQHRGDVTYYNAGQYGANAGGGSLTHIAADSGLWSLTSPVGGYFSTLADRANYTSGAPPYAVTGANSVAAYLVGAHSGGRTDSWNLAMRNDTPIGTGPAVYEYELDSFDFGGIAPATVTSGPVQMGFYFCPNPGDTPDPSGASKDKFTMSFKDSLGNIGFQWGYLRDNGVVWRDDPSDPWNLAIDPSFLPVVADQTNWDGLTVDIDLTANTFSMDYYDVSTNTTFNIVPAATPMGQAMNDFTVLGWQLEDGLFAGNAGKNFFDDFGFTAVIPEPSSAALAMLACLALFGVRRRTLA
jgi:hypothetical protein